MDSQTMDSQTMNSQTIDSPLFMNTSSHNLCPLCGEATVFFQEDKKRRYFLCHNCSLVHVPAEYQLSNEHEKEEYDKHENSFEDDGYRQFLSRMLTPVLGVISDHSVGMDFGCGPAPVLASMFRDYGHDVSIYDKYYFSDESVFDKKYDFVVTTEVIEHLADPWHQLLKIKRCIKPNGILGVMTKRWLSAERFRGWHYKNDPTHIVFFHEQTFRYLANQWQVNVEFIGSDVVLFKGMNTDTGDE
ncbi:class I SAM-dependent methyltransferase [Sessilibacter corallicola]|uniref:Class I SAM-dependent methyltransferase n=2 Tax=Sessilibacter corallicola TaxID=2904075 RepID=A0ABQ0AA79_9GAMM